ncbi:MAG: hypothetical protein J7L53_07095 [Deltaproteobacteria bacterium]|nr:hypothetical protein [Deltaproteobacteria bacterium]
MPSFIGGEVGLIAGVIAGLPPAAAVGLVEFSFGMICILPIVVAKGKHISEVNSYYMGLGPAVHGVIVRSGAYLGLYATGAPFYIAKKTCYDLPRFIIYGPRKKPEQAPQSI